MKLLQKTTLDLISSEYVTKAAMVLQVIWFKLTVYVKSLCALTLWPCRFTIDSPALWPSYVTVPEISTGLGDWKQGQRECTNGKPGL